AVLAVVPILLTMRGLARTTLARQALVAVLLCFVVIDVYHFKFGHLADRSDVIRSDLLSVVLPSKMPFRPRRELDLQRNAASNPRLLATLGFNGMLLARFQGRRWLGAQYWSNNAFWFADEVGATLQAD